MHPPFDAVDNKVNIVAKCAVVHAYELLCKMRCMFFSLPCFSEKEISVPFSPFLPVLFW